MTRFATLSLFLALATPAFAQPPGGALPPGETPPGSSQPPAPNVETPPREPPPVVPEPAEPSATELQAKKLQELEHFESVRTFSRQGYGALSMWLKGGTPIAEQEAAWYFARKKIADVRSQLPAGVIGPVINDEYSDVYSLIWVLQGEGFSYADLNRAAEQIKRQLLEVPMVAKVDVLGKQRLQARQTFALDRVGDLLAHGGRRGARPRAVLERERLGEADLLDQRERRREIPLGFAGEPDDEIG